MTCIGRNIYYSERYRDDKYEYRYVAYLLT